MVRFSSKDLKYVGPENKTITKVGINKNYTIIYFVDQQTKRQIAIYDWPGTESAALTLRSFQQESGDSIHWYISGYVNTKSSVNYLVLQHFGIIKNEKIQNPYTLEAGPASVKDTIRK
ncbi:hypothetical protein FJZ31_01145 [Candidatus Poribacteria bacterium]|nr:hypothetical protein [Candidatus Poribacteria bacterium]